jgi:hypothetical protein
MRNTYFRNNQKLVFDYWRKLVFEVYEMGPNIIIGALWSENHGKSERLAVELLGASVAVSTGNHIQIVVAHIGFR